MAPFQDAPLEVVWKDGFLWSLNNRRLYVFRVAHAFGCCSVCPCYITPRDLPTVDRVTSRWMAAWMIERPWETQHRSTSFFLANTNLNKHEHHGHPRAAYFSLFYGNIREHVVNLIKLVQHCSAIVSIIHVFSYCSRKVSLDSTWCWLADFQGCLDQHDQRKTGQRARKGFGLCRTVGKIWEGRIDE